MRTRRLGAGVAEAAGEGAADLGGDADSTSVFDGVGDVDGLDGFVVTEFEEEFAGGVFGELVDRDFGAADDEVLGQFFLQGAGDAGHGCEVGDALVVDPVPELFGAEGFFADGFDFGGEFGAGQAYEVAAAVGEVVAGWGEEGGFGEDAVAVGGG